MIITDPAAAIIRDTFTFLDAKPSKPRLFGRSHRATNPFSSKAYSEAIASPSTPAGGAAPTPLISAIQRRRSPLS